MATKKSSKKGLWDNINARKRAGKSRPKSASTVDPKAIKKSQASSKKKAATKKSAAKKSAAKKSAAKKSATKKGAAKK